MAEPFVGEIRMFAGTFNPRGWALCDGQLLSVSQNDALFSLFGTIYGGDGRTTFGLPDLRGRIPIHAGDGPGLSNRRLGSKSGSESETLTVNELPTHSHSLVGTADASTSKAPSGLAPGQTSTPSYYSANEQLEALNSASVLQTGGSQSHTNLMPAQCVNFIVALVGVYPSRS